MNFTTHWAELVLIYKKRKQTSEGKHTLSPKGTVDIVIMFYEALYEKKAIKVANDRGQEEEGMTG